MKHKLSVPSILRFLLLLTPLLIGISIVLSRPAYPHRNETYELLETATLEQNVPPPDFTVAFLGDQGLGPDSEAVLALVKSEAADMVLHQGDFDYVDDPEGWDEQINLILGSSFPYFASVGNHDLAEWPSYQQKLVERLARIPEATCIGDIGVNATCHYQGLFFVLSGVGTLGFNHEAYLHDQLAANGNMVWRVCSWHKNQRPLQVGLKTSDVGWEAYEICREAGAIIATGHEHSYSRTKTLSDTTTQTVATSCLDNPETPDTDICLSRGKTFVFVSGISGQGIRNQDRCLPTVPPYGCNGEWAKIYSSDQGATHGALFIRFHVDGDPNKAVGYFKTIDGDVIDSFEIITQPTTDFYLPVMYTP